MGVLRRVAEGLGGGGVRFDVHAAAVHVGAADVPRVECPVADRIADGAGDDRDEEAVAVKRLAWIVWWVAVGAVVRDLYVGLRDWTEPEP